MTGMEETMLAQELQVREEEDGEMRMVVRTIKNVITICDNELSKTMRTNDADRDRITSSVKEQVEVAIEMLRSNWLKKYMSGMQSIQQGDAIEQDNLNSDSARSANTGRSRDEQLGSIPDPHEHAQSQLQHRNSQPRSLEDASRTLSTPEQYAAIIWVGPTKEQNEGEAEWLEIVASLGKHLKAGSRIVGVSPPRGEENWKEARRMQAEAVRLLKQSVQIAADNVISKIPQDLVPVFDEPFAALAASSRSRNNDAYHTEAVKGYYRALQDNLSADTEPRERLIGVPSGYGSPREFEYKGANHRIRDIFRDSGAGGEV
ncbi:unnamed protein product [Heligmosomoides polygyrus]|uniref:DUF2088 domain-containing protein n=1 Tax=Heligmosomoides polygyrus TaxID=6339 RepID=A0A183FKF3_HELPZ|nr:unnamed protein product [Heligmosomoides polygyrus]